MVDAVDPTVVTVTSKDGTEIACWRSGTGPALLLVHGATVDHKSWNGVVPELEPYFTLYTMDRRGRGGSGDTPTYMMEREFEDVAAVVNSIGGTVHVFGHAYGANCALEASQLTTSIGSLVLYDPLVISAGPEDAPAGLADELDELVAQDRRDEAAGLFYQKALGMSSEVVEQLRADPAWVARVASAHTLGREMRAINSIYRFPWNRAHQFDRPTLLMTGELTLPRQLASLGALQAVLPNNKVVVLRGHGHAGPRTAPQMVAAEVLNFLRSSAA